MSEDPTTETKVNPDRLARFMTEYERILRAFVKAYPERYSYGEDRVPDIVDNMRISFVEGAHSGKGWPLRTPTVDAASKALGIRLTWKALGAYLRGES